MTAHEMDAIGPVGAVSSSDYTTSHESSTYAIQRSEPTKARETPVTAAPAVPVTSAASANPTKSTASAVQAAVVQANANLANYNRVLDFGVDAGTGLSVATIRDSQTGVVLQQIPGPDMLHLAKMLADWSPGKTLQLDLLA
jgi:uncharacterized FlaG/YvyC family protein